MSFGRNVQFLRKMRNQMTHMQVNGLRCRTDDGVIGCFEREYDQEGVHFMDVHIALA